MLVDKPAGPTSHDVVVRARRVFGLRAIGHAGTLDPFATGLLVLLVGRATRLARFVEGQPKRYLATARLGVRTATDDPTGAVLAEARPEAWPGRVQVDAALAQLQGPQRQLPPAYSAKLVQGQRSYRLARKGREVTLEPVAVTVHAIELLAYEPPSLTFRATVSPGTYLRALGRDLGASLGVGAHLTALRREAVGRFEVDEAMPLDRLDPAGPVVSPEALVADLPSVVLEYDEAAAVAHGRDVRRAEQPQGEAALFAGGKLVAVARAVPGGWHPALVLSGAE